MISLNKNPDALHRIGDRYRRFFNFDHFLGRNAFEDSWMVNGRSNIRNGKKSYKINIALPGFTKDDVELKLYRNVLSVKIFKDSENPDKELIEENGPIKFGRRYYQLPGYVDQEKLKAHLQDGLLKIRIPYKPDYRQDKPKRIEVT